MRICPVMNYSFSRKNTSGLNAQPVNYSKPSALSQNSEISNIPFTGWFGFQDKISKTLKIENIFKNGKAAGFIEYFDSNAGKKLQRKLETDEFGNFLADTRYVYKPNNRRNELLKTFNYDKNGKFLWETRYEYQNGRIVETGNYDINNNLLHKTEYTFEGKWLDMTIDKTPDDDIKNKIHYFHKEGSPMSEQEVYTNFYPETPIEFLERLQQKPVHRGYFRGFYPKSETREFYESGKIKSIYKDYLNKEMSTAKVDYKENGEISNVHIYHDYKSYDYRPDGTLKQFEERKPGTVPKVTEYYEDGKTVKNITAKKPGGNPDDFELVEQRDAGGHLLYQKVYEPDASANPRQISNENFYDKFTHIITKSIQKNVSDGNRYDERLFTKDGKIMQELNQYAGDKKIMTISYTPSTGKFDSIIEYGADGRIKKVYVEEDIPSLSAEEQSIKDAFEKYYYLNDPKWKPYGEGSDAYYKPKK